MSQREKFTVHGLFALVEMFFDFHLMERDPELRRLFLRVANQACRACFCFGNGDREGFEKYRGWCRRSAARALAEKAPALGLVLPSCLVELATPPKRTRRARA